MMIVILFGILAYRNVQQIAYRAVPLVRRELDKQLTVMVLVEVLCDVIFVTPLIIQNIYNNIIGAPSDPYALMQYRLIMNFTTIWYFFRFMVRIVYGQSTIKYPINRKIHTFTGANFRHFSLSEY
jgi:hypothetical protein